jgi:hypothetical protein
VLVGAASVQEQHERRLRAALGRQAPGHDRFHRRRFGRERQEAPPVRRTFRRAWADVAQLVEQLIRNQQVSGSSPLVGSKDNPEKSGFFVCFGWTATK